MASESQQKVTIQSIYNNCYWRTTNDPPAPIKADMTEATGLSTFFLNGDGTISGLNTVATPCLCILDGNNALILADGNYTGDIPTFTPQAIDSGGKTWRIAVNGQAGTYLAVAPGELIKTSQSADQTTEWTITSE